MSVSKSGVHVRARTILGALLLSSLTVPLPSVAQEGPEGRVTSTVVEEGTGRPVATVHVTAGSREVATNEQGHFSIVVEGPETVVEFRRLGYASLTLPASAVGTQVRLATRPFLLESFVVEALGRQVLAEGTALAAQSIRREDVSAGAPVSLAEAIDDAEGLSVSFMGAWGSRPVLRGLSGERLAVMVDGMRVNRACTYGMDQGLSTIDPALVERVEVLSGPGSTLYGSGNVGGAINVVTRSASPGDGFGGEVRLSASSGIPGSSLGATLDHGGESWDGRISVDGSYFGDYRSPAGVVDGSSYRQLTSDAKLGFDLAAAQRLSFHGQLYEGRDIGWPMRGDASIPEEGRKSVSVDYGWQRNAGVIDGVSAKAYVQRLDHFMVMNMTMPMDNGMLMTSSTEAGSRSTTSGARVQARLTAGSRANLDVGTEATYLKAEGTRWTTRSGAMGMEPSTLELHTWPGVGILDVGGFGQGEVRPWDRVTFSAGVRLDHVVREADDRAATTEWITTGNVGTKITLGGGFLLRSTLGYGYRVPDALELFGLGLKPDGFIYRGSPDLKTETSRNVEASLSWTGRSVFASVTGFRNDLNGMILPVLVEGETVAGKPVREYDNVADARLTGVSVSATWELDPRLRLGAGADYTRGQNRVTGTPLPLVPPLETSATARVMPSGPEGAWFEVEGRVVDRQGRPATSAGEVETPGYGLVDLRSGFSLGETRLAVGVDNVFDRSYRSHLDPATLLRPGRNLYLRATRSF